jgi:hypothetical protein
MFRTRIFWIGFALASLLATFFSVRYFSTAFPLLSIDIRMDRDAALTAARDLAQRHAWPPAGFDKAVSFSGDPDVQNFIELEGGGKSELARIVRERLYSPYKWTVRHFKEGDAHETRIRFTPEGQPYGFAVKLPEKEAGATMDVEAARTLAQSTAERDWQIDFAPYQPAESSKVVRPGGRTDHTFVYERQDARPGEGRYRLRLVVGGDKLTELTHFVQVPEAFSRRYAEMRSKNDSISVAASIAVVGYLIGFCGVGLFFMMRQQWVVWRQPVMWALLIAALTSSDTFNMWSFAWMDYDTALPASGFALRQAATAIGLFMLMTVLLSISFMAAETLSRRAFPHHYQLWRMWSRPAGASKDVLGYTLTGYLLITIFFAYEIVLYAFAHGRLGWWSPSDTLVNPNVFGAYLPSLSAVANSAQAGFWEECLFRAVPLAAAALIGDRFGKRRAFIIGMMVLQALVFGAGHAGYANQPAYARVVELIIPSLAFGALYLAFGLLPGIILHYAFDLVWFSLPIFFSSSPRAKFEQGLVLLLGLLPLGVILYQRLRSPSWVDSSKESLNRTWEPPTVEAVAAPGAAIHDHPVHGATPHVLRFLPVAGLLGLVAWVMTSSFTSDAPPIITTIAQAEAAARQGLTAERVQLDGSWRALPFIVAQPEGQHLFVWQRAGQEKYRALLGTYLPMPRWNVRFARFEGDVAARAEEYIAVVSGEGQFRTLFHQLPEAAPGATLTEEQARERARDHIIAKYDLPPDKLQEVSAEASKRPARTDWDFVFRDTRDYGLEGGEARVSVSLVGDKISYASRYVHVPEEWARNHRARRNIPALLTVACSVAGILLTLAGAIVAIVWWSRRKPFSVRALLVFLALLFVLDVVGLVNSWPALAAQLQTAQPFFLQVAILGALALVAAGVASGAVGLVAGFVMGTVQAGRRLKTSKAVLLGISFGMVVAGIGALANGAGSRLEPDWSGYAGADHLAPFVTAALQPLARFLRQTLILLLVFKLAGTPRRVSPAVPLILIGIVVSGSNIETILSWLLAGLVLGLVLTAGYTFLLRDQPELVPIAVGTIGILSALQAGLQQTYPAILPGTITASILIAIAAWLWFRGVVKQSASA